MRKFITSAPESGRQNAQKPSRSKYSEVRGEQQGYPKATLSQETEMWERRISYMRTSSRMLSSCLNVAMFGMMVDVIKVFLATRNDQALGRSIWPKEPKTWPTYLLLIVALITLIVSIALLVYHCFYFKRATDSWKAIGVSYGVEFTLWFVTTFLYRWEKTLEDLWGWSCADIAKDLQAADPNINFDTLCVIQRAAWVLSLIETAMKVATALVFFIIFRKTKSVEAKQTLAEGLGEGALGLLGAAS